MSRARSPIPLGGQEVWTPDCFEAALTYSDPYLGGRCWIIKGPATQMAIVRASAAAVETIAIGLTTPSSYGPDCTLFEWLHSYLIFRYITVGSFLYLARLPMPGRLRGRFNVHIHLATEPRKSICLEINLFGVQIPRPTEKPCPVIVKPSG